MYLFRGHMNAFEVFQLIVLDCVSWVANNKIASSIINNLLLLMPYCNQPGCVILTLPILTETIL